MIRKELLAWLLLLLAAAAPCQSAAVVSITPEEYDAVGLGPNNAVEAHPDFNDSNGPICFTPTSTTSFLQFEFNEANNEDPPTVTLTLDFWEDVAGGTAGVEDVGEDAFLGPDFGPSNLSYPQGGPSAFEWTLTDLEVGHTYCVDVTVANSNNGADYIRLANSSAVPEPSSFLFLGLLSLGCVFIPWARKRQLPTEAG